MGYNQLIFILLSIAVICNGGPVSKKKPPPEVPSTAAGRKFNENKFVMGEYEFTFIPEKVTWDEATRGCPKMVPESHIAVFNDRKLVPFISTVFAKHPALLEGEDKYWIGGAFDGTSWLWEGSGITIPCKPGPDSYPPWFHEMAAGHKNCLVIERSEADCPECYIAFNGEACLEKHGYICMLDKEKKSRGIQPSKPLKDEGDYNEALKLLASLFQVLQSAAKSIKSSLNLQEEHHITPAAEKSTNH